MSSLPKRQLFAEAGPRQIRLADNPSVHFHPRVPEEFGLCGLEPDTEPWVGAEFRELAIEQEATRHAVIVASAQELMQPYDTRDDASFLVGPARTTCRVLPRDARQPLQRQASFEHGERHIRRRQTQQREDGPQLPGNR